MGSPSRWLHAGTHKCTHTTGHCNSTDGYSSTWVFYFPHTEKYSKTLFLNWEHSFLKTV